MNAATVSARFAELFPESNLIGLLSRYGGDADDIFYGWTTAVILLTEQCLQCRLHLSVKITVPRIGSFFRSRIVLTPKAAKCRKEDGFIVFLLCIIARSLPRRGAVRSSR